MKNLMLEEFYTKENSDYLKKNPTWHMEDSPWKARQVLKMLSRNPIECQTIVEVGCGAGEILNQLHAALPKSVVFTGYDISPDCINLAKKKEKDRLQFRYEDFLETDEHVDLLLMIDVFEHVSDYLGFLKLCKNKARHTIFHIPLDLSAQAILRNKLISKRMTVGHLHYFTKETALASLMDAGYEIIDFFYTAGSVDFPPKTLQSQLAFLPRKIMFKINEDLAVKLFGGYSLMVLTK
jgi:2-polyprenyl-3-methyl-5-hydroxy-6-metoxy-1,4-benzoquinol methylase